MTNTAPTILNPFLDLILVSPEDSALNILGISINDPDTGDTQTVTLSVNHGILNLATTTNLTVTDNGTGAVTISGLVTDINDALASSLTYTPAGNYNGDDTLTVTVSDGVNNTDTNNPPAADSSIDATTTIALSITPINDDPILNPIALTVAEGGQITFDVDQLRLRDPDLVVDASGNQGTGQQVLAQQIVKITAIPTQGTLRLGSQILQVGSIFSYDQLNTVKYIHNGSDVSLGDMDSFKVTVNDGGGGQSPETTVNVDLTPVNVAPTIASPDFAIYEGTISNSIPLILSLGDNFDNPANSTITIVSVNNNGQGTLLFNGNPVSNGLTFSGNQLGLLTFDHNGNEPVVFPSFVIRVEDAGGGTGTPAPSINTTVVIKVKEVNDDPTLTVNNPLSVLGGSTTPITFYKQPIPIIFLNN